jgi:NADPH:quinone reductase-like Zn-dependent oxidoreductase
MRAVVFDRYGSPARLELRDLAVPEPGADEVLLRVAAVSLNDWDHAALLGDPWVNRLFFGFTRPRRHRRILGSDVAGVIEKVGANVTRFARGDRVFGDLSGRWGGLAAFCRAPVASLEPIPAGLSFVDAAALPQAGLLAWQAMQRLGAMPAGKSLLINGAGGGVGTIALQLATMQGAAVTVVDRADKLERLRALGASDAIDFAREDFTAGARTFDFVLDVKTTRSPARLARALKPGGLYVTVGGETARLLQLTLPGVRDLHILALKPNVGLVPLSRLCEEGRVRPIVDRVYELADTRAAFARFGAADHFGKIVVRVGGE